MWKWSMRGGAIALLGGLGLAVAPAASQADSLVYVKGSYVYVARADGSASRVVSPPSRWWAWPSESDGGTIAVAGGAEGVNTGGSSETSGSSEIYAFDQQGNAKLARPVNTPGSFSSPALPQYVDHFRLSPDGNTVAYDVIGCCGASGETTFLSPLRTGASWQQYMDDYIEPSWVAGSPQADALLHKQTALVLTHNGSVFFGQSEYGFWDPADATHNSGWNGDTAIPDGWAYQATIARASGTIALFLDDAPDVGGTAQHVQIHLESIHADTTVGDDCTITLPAGAFSAPHNLSQASLSFSSDGRLLAWGQPDGVYEANVSNPGDCAAVAGSLHRVIAGGAMPAFGAAPLSRAKGNGKSGPAAVVSFSPRHPKAGHAVRFSAARSRDRGGRIVRYTWSFGDHDKAATGVRVTHTFKRPGRYTVTLRLTDSHHRHSTGRRRVDVGR